MGIAEVRAAPARPRRAPLAFAEAIGETVACRACRRSRRPALARVNPGARLWDPREPRGAPAGWARGLPRRERLYYVENRPEITDAQFDVLLRELLALEEKYPELARSDSLTRR